MGTVLLTCFFCIGNHATESASQDLIYDRAGWSLFLKCITKIFLQKISWKLQKLFKGLVQENLMPSVFPASQLPAYGCHVMQLLNEAKNPFLKFPTIFYIEENCGVVEIPFPTIVQSISLLLCTSGHSICPWLC